jgi:hypothetical protein
MDRAAQLRERDVLKESPPVDPRSFLAAYIKSNFPQTATRPSKDQRAHDIFPPIEGKRDQGVGSKMNIRSGTSFDKPEVY